MQVGDEIRVGFRERERKGENPIGYKIDAVCKRCNEQWMSGLETAARPTLEPLIRGDKHQLTIDSQNIVAQWLTMKLMVIDADPRASDATFLPLELAAFKESGTIADALRIWITHLDAPQWRSKRSRGSAALFDTRIDRNVRADEGNNIHMVTWGIGALGVVAAYSRFSGCYLRNA